MCSRNVEWIHIRLPLWFIFDSVKQILNIDRSINGSGTTEELALNEIVSEINVGHGKKRQKNGFRRDWKLYGVEKLVTAGPVSLKWRAII